MPIETLGAVETSSRGRQEQVRRQLKGHLEFLSSGGVACLLGKREKRRNEKRVLLCAAIYDLDFSDSGSSGQLLSIELGKPNT